MFYMKKIFIIGFVSLFLFPNCSCCSDKCKLPKSSIAYESQKNGITAFELDGTKNTRDLGGYKTFNGKTTKMKVFFRSDNTDNLSDSDIKKLKEEYNLKYVIDLRYAPEIGAAPDKFSDIEGITYYNIPLFVPIKSVLEGEMDLGGAYIKMLDQKYMVKNIFDTIANIDDGALLFHCTHGKDRTGVVSALLLGLCGVSNEDIISNYAITYDLIKDSETVKKGIERRGTDVIFKSPPIYMEKLLDYIKNRYKCAENYLLECDISQENINKIKERFLD